MILRVQAHGDLVSSLVTMDKPELPQQQSETPQGQGDQARAPIGTDAEQVSVHEVHVEVMLNVVEQWLLRLREAPLSRR